MNLPCVAQIECYHDCWSNPTETTPDVSLDVSGIGTTQDSAFGMVRMQGPNDQKKRLYEKIKNHKYTIECFKKSTDLFFIRVRKDTSFYAWLVSHNHIVDNWLPIHNGIERERIFGFSKKSLMDSLSRIKEDREVKLVSIKPLEGKTLNTREEKLLSLAMRKGYYEIPRKVYVQELAEEIGLKKSVVFDRLRRVEKKIIESYYSVF